MNTETRREYTLFLPSVTVKKCIKKLVVTKIFCKFTPDYYIFT